MKRCPECGREYDSSMRFCLDDGAELLYGPAPKDEPATAVIASPHVTSEDPTRSFRSTDIPASNIPFIQRPQANPKSKMLLIVSLAAVGALAAGFLGYRYLGSAGAGQIDSIAVLPLQNSGGNADSEYLSDGLAESLIYRLSQLPSLKVSSASSVMRYKGQPFDAKKIAGELGVRAVLSGRLVQRGDNLSISVELIDASTNNTLWGEQYDRKMSDLLATQREIAATISDKLQVRLSGTDQKRATKRYTENNEAYQEYLRGRHHWNKRTKEGIEKGILNFQKAIELDPTFALAYVGIASSYNVMPSYAYMSPKEATPKAISAAKRALEIDPDLAEAHSAYGTAASYEHRWSEVESAMKRAIELDPNSAQSHFRYAIEYLAPTGHLDEAIAEIDRALQLEPLSIPIGANLAGLYVYSRKYDLALENALKVNALDNGHPTASYWLGWAYVANGKYQEAIDLCEKVLPSQPDNQDLLQIIGYAQAKAGRPAETERILAKFAEMEKKQYVVPYRVATLYAALGNKDRAFAEMERSYEARDWDFNRLKVDPFIESLRDDQRFEPLLKKLNLPE
jgi:TolB-like protein/Flp pilus assembly protein TadD